MMISSLFLLSLAAFAVADVDESNVLVLTSDNFDKTVADNEFVLAEFYAPWCGHCKKLTPEYAKAANALAEAGSSVKLAKIDATEEQALASKFGVRGYPTLKWFRSGKESEYNGPREADGIVNWVTKKSGPASTELSGADAVADFVANKARVVVGSFKERAGDAYTKFIEAAKGADVDDFAFADFVGGDDTVTLYTDFADASTVTGDITEFVLANGYPLVDQLPEAYARYQKAGNTLAILFTDPSADNKDLLAEVTKAAEAVKGKFSFSFADGVRFAQQIERMGGKTGSLPTIAAMKMNGKANYPYDGELTADALTTWATGIVDGAIKPTLKSEEVPAEQGALVKIVGKNYQQYFDATKDGSSDMLLEVYAPWCGHCKSLAPKYEELAQKFASNDKIVIAQVDGTANDIEDLEVQGFPSIFWISNGKATKYAGGREVDDFVTYIEKNSKNAKGGDDAAKSEL